MKTASTRVMIAKNLEDLQVHQQALDAAGAVSAILDRPAFAGTANCTSKSPIVPPEFQL
jgi:hypothetical protein